MFDSVRYRMYAAVDDAIVPSGLLARISFEECDDDIAYRVDVLEPFDLRVVEDEAGCFDPAKPVGTPPVWLLVRGDEAPRPGMPCLTLAVTALDGVNESGEVHAAEVVNLRTHPEIEMLVIINEGMYGKYTNGSKRLKPSDYCKRELGMKQVKSRAWLERYWAASGFREPASCGAPADCQHGAHLVEDASLVLLRCLHVLIPESQGDLSLRRHADPVFHKTSQTGPVPFALIPDEAPLCTTRSKNVRHVAHAVKSRVRTIMLDRRVYRVAMQAKGGR